MSVVGDWRALSLFPLPAGDVSVLSGLKESLAKGRHSLSKRMFKKKGVSPSKDTLKHTVHVSHCRCRCWLGLLAAWQPERIYAQQAAAVRRRAATGALTGGAQLSRTQPPPCLCEPAVTLHAPFTPITCVQEMQDALTSSEEEKNALKRQLAKLSKKYQQVRLLLAGEARLISRGNFVGLEKAASWPSWPRRPAGWRAAVQKQLQRHSGGSSAASSISNVPAVPGQRHGGSILPHRQGIRQSAEPTASLEDCLRRSRSSRRTWRALWRAQRPCSSRGRRRCTPGRRRSARAQRLGCCTTMTQSWR